jgi:hypothetical protein
MNPSSQFTVHSSLTAQKTTTAATGAALPHTLTNIDTIFQLVNIDEVRGIF